MEDFMAFIGSNEAIAKNFEYLMYGLNLSADQMAGLDSYSSENDERMLELMAESKKRSGGHWFLYANLGIIIFIYSFYQTYIIKLTIKIILIYPYFSSHLFNLDYLIVKLNFKN